MLVEGETLDSVKSKVAGNTSLPAAPAPAAASATDPFANNKLFTSDAVAKTRARLKSKLGQLNSGIDPEMVIDGMTIARAYIEARTRSFAAYAQAMTENLGDRIKPYLLSFYEAARNYSGLDTQGMTPFTEAKAAFDALKARDNTGVVSENGI